MQETGDTNGDIHPLSPMEILTRKPPSMSLYTIKDKYHYNHNHNRNLIPNLNLNLNLNLNFNFNLNFNRRLPRPSHHSRPSPIYL